MTDKLYDIATSLDNCLAADKFSCCCGILMFIAVTTCQATSSKIDFNCLSCNIYKSSKSCFFKYED